jgi:GxxExxY protein
MVKDVKPQNAYSFKLFFCLPSCYFVPSLRSAYFWSWTKKVFAMELFLKDEVYSIIGAAIEVHRILGSGFLEAVYQESLAIELLARAIPFKSQWPLKISYKGTILQKEYIADFTCFESVIVEIKTLSRLTGNEEAQIINYLKATGYKVGLLINFGSTGKLEWKKIVY